MRSSRARRLSQLLALGAALLGLLGLLGYLYHAQLFITIGSSSWIALPTTVTIMVLAGGLLCALPDGALTRIVLGEGPGGRNLRILWPTFFLLSLICAGLALYGARLGHYDAVFTLALAMIGVLVTYSVILFINSVALEQAEQGRRQAERTLRESEAKYRNLFENITEEVHFWKLERDEDGRIITWRLVDANPPTLKTWGKTTLAEIQGKTTDEIFGSGATDHYLPIVNKVMREGIPYRYEDYFPHLDKTFLFTTVPFGDYFITTGSDISSIKLAQRQHEERHAELEAVFAAMQDAVLIYDTEMRVRQVNPMFVPTHGFDPVGLHVREVIARTQCRWQDGRPFQFEAQPTPRALGGEIVRNQRYVITRPDGAEMALETSSAPMRIGDQIAGTVTVWHDITERVLAEKTILASLHEKEVLLKEIHHRVKNNMQIISSLVSLQADTLDNPTLQPLFNDLRDRVRTMALVHEKLYQSDSLAEIDFAEYTGSLLHYLWRANGDAASNVRLRLAVQPVSISIEQAVPCGLMLNEMVTNALKHAFRERADGELTVVLHAGANGAVCLRVSDNGVGLPADWRQSSSLGLRLVQMLTEQVRGTLDVQTDGGTAFTLTFMQPATAKSGETIHA